MVALSFHHEYYKPGTLHLLNHIIEELPFFFGCLQCNFRRARPLQGVYRLVPMGRKALSIFTENTTAHCYAGNRTWSQLPFDPLKLLTK